MGLERLSAASYPQVMAPHAQSAKAAETTKVQEQLIRQEQVQQQDLSKGLQQTTTIANASYVLINGKPAIVTGNKNTTNTKETPKTKDAKNTTNPQKADASRVETQRTNSTYYNAYTYQATNPLQKGIDISAVARGLNIQETQDEDEETTTSNTSAGSVYADEDEQNAALETIHWVTEDIRSYYNKHVINNQGNQLFSQLTQLSGNYAASAYTSTQEAMAGVK